MLLEEEAVAAGDGEQVDVGVETDGAGDHRRVAVSSWAMPPESSRAPRVGEARGAEHLDERGGLGQIGHRTGKVAVGVAVREQPPITGTTWPK